MEPEASSVSAGKGQVWSNREEASAFACSSVHKQKGLERTHRHNSHMLTVEESHLNNPKHSQ